MYKSLHYHLPPEVKKFIEELENENTELKRETNSAWKHNQILQEELTKALGIKDDPVEYC